MFTTNVRCDPNSYFWITEFLSVRSGSSQKSSGSAALRTLQINLDKLGFFPRETNLLGFCLQQTYARIVLYIEEFYFVIPCQIYLHFFIGNIEADVSVSLHHRENTAFLNHIYY